ncbi:MAG: M23 family metallopeptidase [Clostridia bacterium]|nr:M23 family metallopeptidase [Clostridia bacterium]
MNEKKDTAFIKALKRVEDKGFYIILSLCIIAIGVSGYVLFVNNETESVLSENPESVWSLDDVMGDISTGDNDEDEEYVPTPPEIDIENLTKETEKDNIEVKTAANLPKAILPTEGGITRGFSGNELLYDVTMCDYRTHNGTDFSCTQGDSIFCLRDGKVDKVYDDGLFGWTVRVRHSDGIVSSYSGLSPGISLNEGDDIKMGDPVGTAGGTAIGEINEPFHVHVCAEKDGKYIDVMSLFE